MTSKLKKIKQTSNWKEVVTNNIILILIGVLLIGVVVGLSLNTKETPNNNLVASNDTVFSQRTLDVAKKFACSCGTCDELNLAYCVCGVAIGTKKFIQGNLESGMAVEELVPLIDDIYGFYLGEDAIQPIY